MKRKTCIFILCCMVMLLLLSACSNPEQPQAQSTNNPETTAYWNNYSLFERTILVDDTPTESEEAEIARQSQFLQDAGIEEMNEKTANVLAGYFVRCHRIDPAEEKTSIVNARYEKYKKVIYTDYRVPWGHWILTSSNGTEYWLWGFSDYSFQVIFVHRDSVEGEILYGYYR